MHRIILSCIDFKELIIMMIRPSTCLRNDYNEIADFCKTENQPVFLTKNGEGDLVVMSMEAYAYREEMLDLREKLLEAEAQRLSGAKTFSLDEVNSRMEEIINGSI
jgi:PHD/YefM family antitoxin component YafN of YafNO toxin-antitoxin module